ncbi:MAG: hypothetical protein A3K83_00840 [Omnitrophica WOR_2 bacterium RBG_13_44_8b]|nr:MAG: hypothetical protein A3K83_00840 [Omnitrophica WOR_2 bacterium RBG_13_44_8b]
MKALSMAIVGFMVLAVSFSCIAASPYVGTWQCVEYTRGGQSIPTMQAQGKLLLNEDGTYLQAISTGIEEKGIYTIEGETIKLLQHDKVKMQGVIAGDTITLEFKPTLTKIVYQR